MKKDNMNKKPITKNNSGAFAKKRKFKHGTYAVILTAAFVVVVILLNIGATVLASKVSLSVDLTANKDFTISEENEEYIKDIERDVHIVVCCDRDTYVSSYYSNLIGNNYVDSMYMASQGSSTDLPDYFNQNTRLLDEYTKLNSRITVEYADPQDPEFKQYSTKYSSANLSIGDIIVESEFKLDGKDIKHHKVLGTEDIFTIDDSYASYGISLITANRIESAITSAIYAVTSDSAYKVLLITANGGQNIDELKEVMEKNNYEFTVWDTTIGKETIPEDIDLVIIPAPTEGYGSDREIKLLTDYLFTDKIVKRSVLYINSDSVSNNSNQLLDFVEECGFTVDNTNTLVETDGTNDYSYYGSGTLGYYMTADNGYTDSLAGKDYTFIAKNNTAITVNSTADENTSTKIILEIPETAVERPIDADSEWTSENGESNGPYVGLGVTRRIWNENGGIETGTGTFIMLNSIDYITSPLNDYAKVGNISVLLKVIDTAVGREDAVSFDTRTFETASFLQPSEAEVTLIRIIFIGVLPVAILTSGIVVWVRRRRS